MDGWTGADGLMDGWTECARPKVRNKWQVVVVDFVDSGNDCWCRKFKSSSAAREGAKSLRTAARVLRERGMAADVSVAKRDCWVYLMKGDAQ